MRLSGGITERINAGSVKVRMKPIKGSIIALALAVSWTPFNLWAEQSETELLKQARVTKHQAKRIALARVKHGTIKSAELEKENGVLIWSFDVAQPGKKDVTEVWVDATTGKITKVDVETPITQKKEAAEDKAQKWLSR
jgi:peptidase YpeB-like protein